jgi:uncharacterized membrane protein
MRGVFSCLQKSVCFLLVRCAAPCRKRKHDKRHLPFAAVAFPDVFAFLFPVGFPAACAAAIGALPYDRSHGYLLKFSVYKYSTRRENAHAGGS